MHGDTYQLCIRSLWDPLKGDLVGDVLLTRRWSWCIQHGVLGYCHLTDGVRLSVGLLKEMTDLTHVVVLLDSNVVVILFALAVFANFPFQNKKGKL